MASPACVLELVEAALDVVGQGVDVAVDLDLGLAMPAGRDPGYGL